LWPRLNHKCFGIGELVFENQFVFFTTDYFCSDPRQILFTSFEKPARLIKELNLLWKLHFKLKMWVKVYIFWSQVHKLIAFLIYPFYNSKSCKLIDFFQIYSCSLIYQNWIFCCFSLVGSIAIIQLRYFQFKQNIPSHWLSNIMKVVKSHKFMARK